MIQRIQTLYLTGVAILAVLLLFIPLAVITGVESTCVVRIYDVSSGNGTNALKIFVHNYLLTGDAVAVLSLSAITIFYFRNRPLQLKLSRLNMLLTMALLAGMFYHIEMCEKVCAGDQKVDVNYQTGVFLPIFMIILLFLALWSIRKDEERVRSSGRIRK